MAILNRNKTIVKEGKSKKEQRLEAEEAERLRLKAKKKIKLNKADKSDKPEKSDKSEKTAKFKDEKVVKFDPKEKDVKEADQEPEKVTKKGLKKFGKSIGKLGNPNILTEKLMSVISVTGFHIYEIPCEIVKRDQFGITVRYKKPKSRTIRRDTFGYDQVIAIAKHGDKSVIYVRSNRAFIQERGSVKRNEITGWFECTNTFGEVFEINPFSKTGVDVQSIAAEDEDFVGGGKQKNSKRVIEENDDKHLEEDEDDV